MPSTGVKRIKRTKKTNALVPLVTDVTFVTHAVAAIGRPGLGCWKLAGLSMLRWSAVGA